MTKLRRILLPAFALPFAAIALHAQSQPSSSSPPSVAKSQDDETVKLSEFSVSAKSTTGYTASESMTGTRVATQIKDLPFTINVVTSEFLEDFAIFQLDDTLTQIGGLTSLDIGGSFNLRGFSSSSQLRDGFYRLGRYGQTNIDRIEIIKGPNAGIYGRTSPGGMVNMISKAPKKAESEKLSVTIGSYKTKRGVLEATGSITKKTYYIVVLSQFEREFRVDIAHTRENQGFVAVKHDFSDDSHLLVSAEYFLQYKHAPTSSAPVVIDQKGTATTTDDVAIGYAKNLAKTDAFGPYSELNRGSITFLGVYDKRFNDVWSARIGVQDFRARRWDYNQNSGWATVNINTAVASNNLLETRGTSIQQGNIQEDGGGVQIDNVLHYHLFNGKVENKTLVTVDLNDYYRWDPTRNTQKDAAYNSWANAATALATGRAFYVTPDYTPIVTPSYFSERFQYGQPYSRLTKRRTTVLGGLFRQETHLFGDHLLTYFGGRYDMVRFIERDFVTAIPGYPLGGKIDRWQHEFKPNVGALYKVTQNFRVYANYSESYFVDQTTNPIDVASSQFKPETAKGFDYGIKGGFFNDRLSYTIGGYYIKRYNVSVTDEVETPPGSGVFTAVTRRDGDQFDRGWEADLNWQATDEISAILSYGHVNAIYTNFGTAFPEAVGRSVNNINPENGSFSVKYTPKDGALKGFSANIQATFVTTTPTESPNQGDTVSLVGGAHVTSSTGQWNLKVPGYTLWNVGVHYKFQTTSPFKFEHSIGVNINNLFDKEYLKPSGGSFGRNIADGRGYYFTYALAFSAFGR